MCIAILSSSGGVFFFPFSPPPAGSPLQETKPVPQQMRPFPPATHPPPPRNSARPPRPPGEETESHFRSASMTATHPGPIPITV